VTAPLGGIRIAVTRARPQAEELAAPLRALGAEVVAAPLIRIEPQLDSPGVQSAIALVEEFDWIVFTSANGVELFAAALAAAGRARPPGRIACVGPATARAARARGFEPALMPGDYTGVAVAGALVAEQAVAGRKVLLARAGGAGTELPRLLEAEGAQVTDIALYRSGADAEGAAVLRAEITAETLDVVTFTSGSSVQYFGSGVGDAGRALVAVIGPVTAVVARAHGLIVSIQGTPNTVDGLVAAIARHFGETGK